MLVTGGGSWSKFDRVAFADRMTVAELPSGAPHDWSRYAGSANSMFTLDLGQRPCYPLSGHDVEVYRRKEYEPLADTQCVQWSPSVPVTVVLDVAEAEACSQSPPQRGMFKHIVGGAVMVHAFVAEWQRRVASGRPTGNFLKAACHMPMNYVCVATDKFEEHVFFARSAATRGSSPCR